AAGARGSETRVAPAPARPEGRPRAGARGVEPPGRADPSPGDHEAFHGEVAVAEPEPPANRPHLDGRVDERGEERRHVVAVEQLEPPAVEPAPRPGVEDAGAAAARLP